MSNAKGITFIACASIPGSFFPVMDGHLFVTVPRPGGKGEHRTGRVNYLLGGSDDERAMSKLEAKIASGGWVPCLPVGSVFKDESGTLVKGVSVHDLTGPTARNWLDEGQAKSLVEARQAAREAKAKADKAAKAKGGKGKAESSPDIEAAIEARVEAAVKAALRKFGL